MITPQRLQAAMSRALFLAHKCREFGDVPVGAVVLDPSGSIIGEGWNQRESHHDPAGHAEIVALRAAGKHMGNWNLSECTLVVTLEPCTMCAGAIVSSRLQELVFGAWDEKAGACGSIRDVVRDSRLNHQVNVVGGVMEEEAAIQLRGFFAEKRMEKLKQESSFWQRRLSSTPPVVTEKLSPPPPPPLVPPAAIGIEAEPTTAPTPAPARPGVGSMSRSERHRDRVIVPPLREDW